MRYEITVSVTDAPGSFDRVSGSVDYRVANDKCVPMTPISGATVVPVKHLAIEFKHAGGNVYKAVVFADLLQDEDYFGLGLCHWSLVGAGADFVAGSVEFSPSIYKEDILASKQVTRFFARKVYGENASDVRIDIGRDSRDAFKNPNDTFSISVKAEKKLP